MTGQRPVERPDASLADRLRRAADELADARRAASIRRSVALFVRLHRSLLLEMHAVAHGWDAVAEVLAGEGLRWRNGRRVTGAQLRALISATRPSAIARAKRRAGDPALPAAPRRPATPPTVRPAPGSGLASLIDAPTPQPPGRLTDD